MNRITTSILATGFTLVAGGAFAADCTFEEESSLDFSEEQVVSLYECVEEAMVAGYAKQGDEIGSTYREWTVTATRAAVEGTHQARALLTFANDIAAPQYMKYEEEGVVMPVGSILAKESVTFSKKKKKARPGPLFVMEKAAAGTSPETGDWVYSGLQPNGKPMKIKQSFCHNCHSAWEDQDSLAYPVEEVRISN